jgi:hypothetical protein
MLPLYAALVTPAFAEAGTSSLSWVRLEGAESCLGAPELARAVEAELGRPVFVPPGGAALAVEGRAERGVGVWRAVLRMTDATGAVLGDRVLESRADTCDELGGVVATTLALMLDPLAPPTEPPPAPPEPPRPRWRVGVDVALTGGAGTVPGVGIGGVAIFVVRPPRFVPLLVQGELVPFARVPITGGQIDLARTMGGAQICPFALGQSALTLDLCVGVDAGVVFVLHSTTDLIASEFALVQAHGAAHLRWRVFGPLVARAGLHPIVPLRPVSFSTADGATVYSPAPVAGFLDVGVGLSF